MKLTGIITEYNPFHKGHLNHINKTQKKESPDGIVCVMSGNFVQRGLPSMIDKWERTNFALSNGVDLVIELPSVYAISSAEFFAHGSVSILDSLKCIDNICFGSELGDITPLVEIAKVLVEEPQSFKSVLKNKLKEGASYPTARNAALSQYFSNSKILDIDKETFDNIINSSNNILGIEYCKSLLRLKSKIKPSTILRDGSSYNDVDLCTEFASATSIRKHIGEKKELSDLTNYLPNNVFNRILQLQDENYPFVFPESAFQYLKFSILSNPSALCNLPDFEEGLDNKFYASFSSSNSLTEAVEKIKSKRYTYTRIYRLLFQLYLQFDKFNYGELRKSAPEYIRVLGFNSKGKDILNKIKKDVEIPIISSVKKKHTSLLQHDIKCTNMYSLLNPHIEFNADFYRNPIYLK